MQKRNKSSPPPRGLRARQHGEAVAAITAYVPVTLAERTRTRAFRDGCTISSLVADALTVALGRSGSGGPEVV